MSLSLYVHIPFCVRKCAYCDFASLAGSGVPTDDYVAGVIHEMALRAAGRDDTVGARTLYVGGGTPSLLTPGLVARIVDTARERYGLTGDAEVTLEANPGTVSLESLAGYREAGVNRLSLGIQSLDDRMLAILGRVHTAAESREAIAAARAVGFDNIGIDLMHSLPGLTVAAWRQTLEQAIGLGPRHLSAYGLTVEEGTPFHRLREEGRLSFPDEDESARMFRLTGEMLTAAGYEQYEIANFALPGCRSRHNQVYWRRGSYLGFGAGAHSFENPFPGETSVGDFGGRRWCNTGDPATYLCSLAEGRLPETEIMVLSRRDAMVETLFLGLRMTEGVDTDRFRALFGQTVEEAFEPEVERLLADGLLERRGSRLAIPSRYLILANQIFVRFV